MPLHDWTQVESGIYHGFHQRWIAALADALNSGILPADHYALPEQTDVRARNDRAEPDVLTLQQPDFGGPGDGGVAVATAPPRVSTVVESDMASYRRRKSVVAVRHASGDRVVARIELVSPGNKSGRAALRDFVDKAVAHLLGGVHLLFTEPFPPTPRDPNGIHAAIWDEIEDSNYRHPVARPGTAAAYEALPGGGARGYVEPVGLGEPWPDMPLFLAPGGHVVVPLEETYATTWRVFPKRWRDVVAPPGGV